MDQKETGDKRKSGFDISAWIPHLITAVTIIIGVYQYNKTTEREIRKEFFYKQVKCYEDITNQVSLMMNNQSTSMDSLRKELNKFKTLRDGSYHLYTTDSVEKYVATFEFYYERYLRNDSITNDDLHIISYKLFNQCRLSLNQTLDVKLTEINFRKKLD
ncbi:hypothetical protein [Mucilaginibacter agri]|uniref:Uncharacterized protein n=1 Tax=Mucilaginibacter agri TaxID=2695265 RepID=A0A966DV32_9SPHI|nr:hypothetical protein [Mucilaginibacter agri]NCD70164.1 hypothetical protein [Mucilaginibacter agri]